MNFFAESAETSIRDDGKKHNRLAHGMVYYWVHHIVRQTTQFIPIVFHGLLQMRQALCVWHHGTVAGQTFFVRFSGPEIASQNRGSQSSHKFIICNLGISLFFSYLSCCSVVQPYLEWLVETTHMLGRVKTTSQVFSEEKPCLEIAYSRWYERSIGKKHLWWRYPCREVQWAVAIAIRSLARFGIAICG